MGDYFSIEVLNEITRIIKKGNSVELKRERDNLVVVEIIRKARLKSPIGQDIGKG